ncbi:MAG TPA: hypothetical protein VG937_17360 [Polyangiaceae bacterium]|nr:hypothetical protein [Polyangiaceae bacterium]
MTDTYRPPASGGQPADSNPPLESGVPPARGGSASPLGRSQAHAAAALSGCARAEANLENLLRGVQHLAAAVSNAREAKADVVHEIETLRSLLGDAEEQQLTLKHRVALLEQALDRTERENAREKAFLLDEQDTFIAGLWDEHAQEVSDLRRRLASAEDTLRASQEENQALTGRGENAHREVEEQTRRLRKAEAEVARLLKASNEERDRLHRVHIEREEAQLAAAQAFRERDQLRAELGRLKAENAKISSLHAPSAEASATKASQSSPAAPIPLVMRTEIGRITTESARMTAARMDKDLEVPRSPSQMSDSTRRPSVPPEELRAAITELEFEPSSKPASSSASRSAIKQKPDPSTRPLIGYSLSGDLPEERIESARPSSRPPR